MAIEMNNFKFVDGERLDYMSSEEDSIQRLPDAELDDDEDEVESEDYDSGAGSDDFDLLELGETGEEFCQIGDQTCSVPFELYDLPDLGDILSMDVWNNVLTDNDRFRLAKYLPDMDQETFMRTMKELFTCCNFHFEVPVNKLFSMLKGGLCEPRVALYRRGLGFFQKQNHYHALKNHQNKMVNTLFHMRESWMKYREYGIQEKLQVLNIMKNKTTLMSENLEEKETSSSDWENYGNGFQSTKKMKNHKQNWVRYPEFRSNPTVDFLEPVSYKNMNIDRLSDIKVLTAKPSNRNSTYGLGKKLKHPNNNLEIPAEDPMVYRKFRGVKLSKRDSQLDMNDEPEPYRHVDWNLNNKNRMIGRESATFRNKGDLLNKSRPVSMHNGGRNRKMLSEGEETESDSSEQTGESDDENSLIRSKWSYPSSVSGIKSKFGMKDRKNLRALNGSAQLLHEQEEDEEEEEEIYSVKAKRKVKTYTDGHLEEIYNLGRNGKFLGEHSGTYKKQKRGLRNDYSTPQPVYLNDYVTEEPESSVGIHRIDSDNFASVRSTKKGQHRKMYAHDVKLSSCNFSKKHKVIEEEPMKMDDEDDHERRKWEDENESQKKPFTLITPTVHTGFSFSIIHLLSAVRMAMITHLPEDSLKPQDINGVPCIQDSLNPPYLTIQEIVNRVKSNPGDPCILETQEPILDLVRGVLKLFSSKSPPLGAKGWKTLVSYHRPNKTWSWIGPNSHNSSSDHETFEEITSPDSWNLSYKILVKLVDSFANWLKSGQETLKQIGSLPDPPLELTQINFDEKERFRDLKAQKSLNTINQSSKEVKDYFQKEEILRYSVPDRVFAYTAVDGKKSTVAPSKKGAGKPTSKARDHFMLKRDRPPHVTVLCLVRDAAARLPGSIGTRADVCTLIRDSQYIVEDVSDSQVNQVVSGALDRLHYERDPCVQFDGERKLWVYLHRGREEEDFEDDATSSTKKWKRPKKESIEPSDVGPAEQTGVDFSNSDLNLDPSDGKQVFAG